MKLSVFTGIMLMYPASLFSWGQVADVKPGMPFRWIEIQEDNSPSNRSSDRWIIIKIDTSVPKWTGTPFVTLDLTSRGKIIFSGALAPDSLRMETKSNAIHFYRISLSNDLLDGAVIKFYEAKPREVPNDSRTYRIRLHDWLPERDSRPVIP